MPLLSVIIPVFNEAKTIKQIIEKIDSVPIDKEIIVVDDGSTDATATVAARYGKQIRYLRQQNAGPAAARNLGLDAATGEFIAFLDADDLWHSEKVERQMACFQESGELDYCVAHVQNFWIPELIEEEKKFRDHRMSKPIPGFCTGILLARRHFFTAVGRFNMAIKHADDTVWFLRANERGARMKLLPEGPRSPLGASAPRRASAPRGSGGASAPRDSVRGLTAPSLPAPRRARSPSVSAAPKWKSCASTISPRIQRSPTHHSEIT